MIRTQDELRLRLQVVLKGHSPNIKHCRGGYVVTAYNLPTIALPMRCGKEPVVYVDYGDYPDR